MSEPALKLTSTVTSSGCKIYDFPNTKSSSETREENSILSFLMGSPKFEGYLKEFIEGVIMNDLNSKMSVSMITKDNPFDPIYLAQILPDIIISDDLERIKYLARNIIDKSDSFEINDGWDD